MIHKYIAYVPSMRMPQPPLSLPSALPQTFAAGRTLYDTPRFTSRSYPLGDTAKVLRLPHVTSPPLLSAVTHPSVLIRPFPQRWKAPEKLCNRSSSPPWNRRGQIEEQPPPDLPLRPSGPARRATPLINVLET